MLKRARKPGSLPGQASQQRPSFPAFRVCKTFTAGGHLFREGMLVNPDSDLVRAIVREYPGYLEPN